MIKIIKKNKLLVAAVVAATASLSAHALQVIEPVEGHNSFVRISAKETTRIAIEGGKIKSLLFTEGELAIERDDERGQVFVRAAVRDKPINIRIISRSGRTYSLILQAVDIPQEDVVLKESLPPGVGDKVVGEKTTPYVKAIRSLINTMATEDQTNITARKVEQELLLWEGTRFVHLQTFNDKHLVGEKYELTNTGKTQIRISEQEFYRKGVQAIAVENMTLDPGKSTKVYVVRAE